MSELALIINTIAKNKDVWPMFFGQIEKHIPEDFFEKKYIFVDDCDDPLPEGYEAVIYEKEKMYREQFVGCIKSVSEEYCIYISEDYILYDDIQTNAIVKYIDILKKNLDVSFVRFTKGGIVDLDYLNYQNHEDLYELYNFLPYFYTNQASVWRTRDLEKIHRHGPNLHIGNTDHDNSFEFQATKTCEQLGIRGLFCYYGEPKRGIYHYDSKVFPHVCTALVKGKWNLSEYQEELSPLLIQHNINTDERGVF
jgi:hypothetical protein